MTSLLTHGIWLPLVLGHPGVNLLDDIRTDWGLENGWEGGRAPARSAIGAVDADGGASSLKSISARLILNSILQLSTTNAMSIEFLQTDSAEFGEQGIKEPWRLTIVSFVVESVGGFLAGRRR